MSRREVETPIQIEGRGFVVNDLGDYRPGEFRRLNNCELREGRIVSRREIKAVASDHNVYTSNNSFLSIIGHLNEWTLVANKSGQFAINSNQNPVPLWGLGALNVNYNATEFRKLVGFFKYNRTNYWIIYAEIAGIVTISLRYQKETSTDRPIDYNNINNTTEVVLLSFGNTTSEYPTFRFLNFFIHKERLWLNTTTGLYFSRATDPTKFAVVDGGGFFRVPDDNINYTMALNDTIYLICVDSIYTVTYSADPNEDATVRKISEVIGGQHGCIFRDDPYIVNTEGIFALSNGNIQKVVEGKFDTGNNNFDIQTLTPFKEYLILNRSYGISDLGTASEANVVRTNYMYNPRLDTGSNDPIPADLNKNIDIGGFLFLHPRTVRAVNLNTTVWPGGRLMRVYSIDVNSLQFLRYNTIRMPVEGNKDYTLGLNSHVYLKDPIPAGVNYTLRYYDITDTEIGITDLISNAAPSRNVNPTSDARNVFNFKTPLNTTTVRFEIVMNGGENVWLGAEGTISVANVLLEERYAPNADPSDFFSGDSSSSDIYFFSYEGNPFLSRSNKWVYNFQSNRDILFPVFSPEMSADIGGNDLGYNTYFVNMDTMAIHTVSIRDNMPSVGGVSKPGYITQLAFNPNVNYLSKYPTLFIGTANEDAVSSFFYMEPEYKANLFDLVYTGDRSRTFRAKPHYQIEVDSFSPDGTEFAQKKFRSLQVMAKFPNTNFAIIFGYDNSEYLPNTIRQIIDNESATGRPHHAIRMGLNQRGSSISAFLYTENPDEELVDFLYDRFEISNMSLLWTPTARLTK